MDTVVHITIFMKAYLLSRRVAFENVLSVFGLGSECPESRFSAAILFQARILLVMNRTAIYADVALRVAPVCNMGL